MSKDIYDERNRRDRRGVNSVKVYQCFICGKSLESYGAHKRHISTAHGKSTRTYDHVLEKELGHR